jgi:hypothetical protein
MNESSIAFENEISFYIRNANDGNILFSLKKENRIIDVLLKQTDLNALCDMIMNFKK